MIQRLALCVCLSTLLLGCGTQDDASKDSGVTQEDVGNGTDAGSSEDTAQAGDTQPSTKDTAVADSGSAGDTTAPSDTGAEQDTTVADSGTAEDTTSAEDSASSQDSATTPDTTAPDTTAVDSGMADTGTVDAGSQQPISEFATACKTDADCTIACATGSCNGNGVCSYTVGNGCLVSLSADKVACYQDGVVHPKTPCLACNASVTNTQLTSVTSLLPMEDPSEGWSTKDLSGGGMIWTLSTSKKTNGNKSLYFGDVKSKVYANDKHVKGSVTTAEMMVPKHDGVTPQLSFWLYLDTEESKGYDVLSVDITESGGKAKALWSSDSIDGTTHKVWELQQVDIADYAGKKVTVTFTFDSKDSFVNAFEGAYLDDIAIRTGCCGGVADCNDGNACSIDTCAAKSTTKGLPVCAHEVKKDCCSSSADCDDNKPCTLDLCATPGGKCSYNPKPGCCLKDVDCDDKDSCTIDRCPKAGANCLYSNTCCKEDTDCTSEDTCLVGKCASGDCVFSSTCCINDGECDDFNPCTLDTCVSGKCIQTPSKVPGCCSVEPIANEFDVDMDGWTSDKALANKMVWHKGTYKGNAAEPENGAGVMKFGIKGQDTFSNLSGFQYLYVTSPEIELPPGQEYTLEIKYKFALNYKTTLNYMYMYYLVDNKQITSYYNFSQQQFYYVNHKTDKWEIWQKDISAFAGRKFKVKFRARIYGSTVTKQAGQGLMIDYIKVKTSCNPKKCDKSVDCYPASTSCQGGIGICSEGACTYIDGCCKSAADCKSPTMCSAGSCSGGKCKFSDKQGCCMGQSDCNDGNPCTTDSCPGAGKQCNYAPVPGCCLADTECNDNKSCTTDQCVTNKCVNTDVCCKSNADCDDKDSKCTTDTCGANGFCVFKPTNAKGCCEPNLWVNDFSASLKNMVLKNSQGAKKGWQLWTNSTLYKSPKGVLYY
ncbi:MAG: hypothetical protein CMH53_10570, partial [Myxococcales bacterium]|nr:hypothetical protein [Myxococcales bacterium]